MHGTRVRALGPTVLLLALAVGAPATPAQAQRVGLEAGLASVEGHVAPSLGISASLPLTGSFRVTGSGALWTGCDGETGCEGGYGNHGFNLLALYQILGRGGVGASVGAGLGWYERHRAPALDGTVESYYEDALTLAAELRRAVAFNSAAYLRAETSFPMEEAEPKWLLVRLGVDVGFF